MPSAMLRLTSPRPSIADARARRRGDLLPRLRRPAELPIMLSRSRRPELFRDCRHDDEVPKHAPSLEYWPHYDTLHIEKKKRLPVSAAFVAPYLLRAMNRDDAAPITPPVPRHASPAQGINSGAHQFAGRASALYREREICRH